MRKLILLCFLCSQPIFAMDWIFCCLKTRQRARWVQNTTLATIAEILDLELDVTHANFQTLSDKDKSFLTVLTKQLEAAKSLPNLLATLSDRAQEFPEPFRRALEKLAPRDDQKSDE